jgi:hypothetical protein
MSPCHPNFKPFPWDELPSITAALAHVADSKTVYSLAEKGTEEVYWYAIEHGVTNQWLLELLQPSKTIWNKIGELASYGTECTCCLGYRAIIGFVLGTGVGLCLAYLI